MTWIIDTGMYYDAGNKCHLLANDLSLALGPLNAALQNQCGGMAGNHESCNNWISTYDIHANEIVTLAATLANALLRYGDILQANGYNWWHSNRTAASTSAPTKPTESEPLYDSGMALPVSSRGDNGPGLDEGVVVGLLERVGRIPNGDESKLGIARDAWKTFAEHATVTGAATRVSGIKAKFEGSTDPNIVAIEEKLSTLEQAANLLADAAKGIVTPLTEHNDALSTMREDIGKQVAAAAVEIGAAIVLTAVVVGVAAFLTAGVGSVAAGAGGAAVTIEIVESTALIIKNTVTVSRMVTAVGAVITIGVAGGGFTAVPDLSQAGLSAAVGAIAAMAVYIAAEAADDEPVWDSTEERARNPAQDKILTDKDIRELKSRGHDPHDVKPDPASRYDLYKDGKGTCILSQKAEKALATQRGSDCNDGCGICRSNRFFENDRNFRPRRGDRGTRAYTVRSMAVRATGSCSQTA